MLNHEEKARKLHKQGNSCSRALHLAFIEDTKLTEEYPMPRSIDGKCGALLTSLKILRETNNIEKVTEFEMEFVKKFGYATCKDLMTHEKRCNDYVGECAKMLDEIIAKQL